MTKEIQLAETLAKLAGHAKKPLGSSELPVELLDEKLEKDLPVKLSGATFTVTGRAEVAAFNSPDDLRKDPDRILGRQETSDPGKSLKLPPQVVFDGEKAWLRYGLEASAKGSATKSLKDLGFGFDLKPSVEGTASLQLASYRLHGRDEKVGDAVLADLATPRLILSRSDVEALNPGEAVSLRVRGKLVASISVKWADVFASNPGALAALVAQRQTVQLKVSTGLSASLKVTLEDTFTLVISRVDAQTFRLAVRKTDLHDVHGKLGASVSAKFAKPSAVKDVLDDALAGLTGVDLRKIKALLAKTSLASLSDTQRKLLDALLERLGVDGGTDALKALKKKWSEWPDRVDGVLQDIAKAKVELGFAYEYRRIRTGASVYQVKLRRDRLADYHSDAVKGDVGGLLDDLDAGRDGLTLELFLSQTTLQVKKAWGFTLGLGKWVSISGKNRKELKEVVRTSRDGEMVSFEGVRGYEGLGPWGDHSWETDLAASMDAFSAGRMATLDELKIGLHLTMEWEEKLKQVELAAIVDHGVLWGAIDPRDQEAKYEELLATLPMRRQLKVAAQLRFDDAALRRALDVLSQRPDLLFASALAEAMPTLAKDPHGVRATARRRRHHYRDLWRAYLRTPGMTPDDLARAAYDHFVDEGIPTMAERERDDWRKLQTTTLAGLADLNSDTRRQWASFCEGVRLLREGRKAKRPRTDLHEIFRHVLVLWTQSFHVRALGNCLLRCAAQSPSDPYLGVERTLTFTFDDGGGKQTINLTAS